MKKEKNLLYNSDAYYNNNDYYELFSKKEDSLNIIDNYFKSLGNFDVILDAGCGTGKYLNTLENISNKYIGIDLSNDQLKKAKEKVSKENTKLINANLCNIPLEDNSVDLIISCWVLGTISDIKKRAIALKELRRVLKPNGKIILIENNEASEFEIIRNHHIDGKTKNYNEWLINNGFSKLKSVNTKFIFDNKKEAIKCFNVIYGEKISSKIKNNVIEHKVLIFESS